MNAENNFTVAIIPARLESSRLPGKALVDIHGIPMILHVYKRCLLASKINDVYVATDNQQIADVVRSGGGKVLMTRSDHKNGTERIFLKIPFEIAPIKAAILPLNAKDNLPEKAKLLYDELKTFFNIQYDEKDSIGKRYRRQDAIGTPYCITFDYDTLKDNSVTIRNRNSMVQERVLLYSTKDYIINNVSIDNLLTQV